MTKTRRTRREKFLAELDRMEALRVAEVERCDREIPLSLAYADAIIAAGRHVNSGGYGWEDTRACAVREIGFIRQARARALELPENSPVLYTADRIGQGASDLVGRLTWDRGGR